MSEQNNEQQNIAAQIAKDKAKKALAKKAGAVAKKAVKIAAKVAVKAVLAGVKALVGFLLGLGGPFLLIVAGVVILIILVFSAVNMYFTIGGGDLEGEAKELREHIVALSEGSIDPNKPEQIPFKVPVELIIAAMQIYETTERDVSAKDAATIMAEALKPTFTYETYEGKIETNTTICVDDDCTTTPSITPFNLNVLSSVESWDQQLTTTFQDHTTDWETSTSTSTSTKTTYVQDPTGKPVPKKETITTTKTVESRAFTIVPDEAVVQDYAYLDRVLSEEPFAYDETDKLMVESLYALSGYPISYSEWLTGNSLIGLDGLVVPGELVPSEFMPFYLAAEKKYKVDWYYIAAIHFIETGFSTHPTMISGVGAEGHMQFMPCTFVGWSYAGCKGTNGFAEIPDSIKLNIRKIKEYGGMGVDGNGDGKADPWNVEDAIFSAAHKMNVDGFSKNIDKAIRGYNNSSKYVADVTAAANRFKMGAQYMANSGDVPPLAPGSFMRPAAGSISSKFGPRNLKNGYHYGIDIANSNGTPIVAAADGVVIKSYSGCNNKGSLKNRCGGGWGNHVFVQHNVGGQKFVVVYGHFIKTVASTGQQVKQGQIVGMMGMSGSVTGPHLHFEMHRNTYNRPGNAVNPALYVPL